MHQTISLWFNFVKGAVLGIFKFLFRVALRPYTDKLNPIFTLGSTQNFSNCDKINYMEKLITQNSKILGGKPIIKGTRISVEVILEFLAGGMEIREMLREYPFLKMKQVKAAIQYAAKQVGSKKSTSVALDKPQAILHEIHRRR